MRRVEDIERQIQTLSSAEFAELRDWIVERDWKQWDEQIANDVSGGRLDELAAEALAEHRAGKTHKL